MTIQFSDLTFPMHCGAQLCRNEAEFEATVQGDASRVVAVCAEHKTPEEAAAVLGIEA